MNNKSQTFQRMCSMAAISVTSSYMDTLKDLILQILVIFRNDKITNSEKICEIISSFLLIQVPIHQVEYGLEELKKEKNILVREDGSFIPNRENIDQFTNMQSIAASLEREVRENWEKEINDIYPELSFPLLWDSIQNYFMNVFFQHGLHAVRLLNPSIEKTKIDTLNLGELLNESVSNFDYQDRMRAINAIKGFLDSLGSSPKKSQYITQLAEGAYTFFTLTMEPQVADNFRKNLKELTLVVDTNFLYGILGLTISNQVDVSKDLVSLIRSHNFPFTILRHEITDKELIKSVQNYEKKFSLMHWSTSVSNAMLKSKMSSGVELKYHQAFLETKIDVHSYFKNFYHIDELLNDQSIKIYYEDINTAEAQSRIAKLVDDYSNFLLTRNKNKQESLIYHDMVLLDLVRRLRSDAQSSLAAGALLLTCDYLLYAFDWDNSKETDQLACTVLPNLLWQVLRVFIPAEFDYQQAFAQSFSIPDIRTTGTRASEAASKMASLLASYKDMPEELALKYLSNDQLLEKLKNISEDETFRDTVELEILNDYNNMAKENAELSKRMKATEEEKTQVRIQLQETQEKNQILETRVEKIENERENENSNLKAVEKQYSDKINELKNELIKQKKITEKEKEQKSIVAASLISILGFAIFNLAVHYFKLDFLAEIKSSIKSQIILDIVIVFIPYILLVERFQKLLKTDMVLSFLKKLLDVVK